MKYIIANWKMNFPQINYLEYCQQVSGLKTRNKVIISPPDVVLSEIATRFHGLELASQDISHIQEISGSYTGEVSASLYKKLGVNYCIVGHSERRNHFGETNQLIRIKATNALAQDLIPIICVGENLDQRKNGTWMEFLEKQILESTPDSEKQLILAYEPVWAIGTGRAAENSEIFQASAFIRQIIAKLAKKTILVYGGSVDTENAAEILQIPHINGVLVGGASLKLQDFKKIISSND